MLMDHIPRCPCSWYVIQLHDLIVHVLEEIMLEAGVIYKVVSVYIISFVKLLLFLFSVFGEMCGESSCNVFVLLFMVLWVPISVMLCMRAVLML
jgi:hypothetical protein